LEAEANFNRPLRRNELAVNFTERVPKDVALDKIRTWMGELELEEDAWSLRFPASGLARKCAIVFQGPPLVGEDRAKRAFLTLRKPNGVWQEFWIQSPIDKHWIQMYVGRDANPFMLATAALGKKALALAQRIFKGQVNLLKYEGYLTDGWRPFIKVITAYDRTYKIEVCYSTLPRGFPLEDFKAQFALAAERRVDEHLKWV